MYIVKCNSIKYIKHTNNMYNNFADYIVEQLKKQQLQVTEVARYEDSLLKVATIGHTRQQWSYEVKYFNKDSKLPTNSKLARYRDTH